MDRKNFDLFIKKVFENAPAEDLKVFSIIKNRYYEGNINLIYEALRSFTYDGIGKKISMAEILSVKPEKIHPNYLKFFRKSILYFLVNRLHESGETLSSELKALLPDQEQNDLKFKPDYSSFCAIKDE